MKFFKYKILPLLCVLFIINNTKVNADDNPFKIVYPIFSDSAFNIIFNRTDTLDISNINEKINGMSLDCKIIKLNNNSFVRILLEDIVGNNHLVLENNKFNNDTTLYIGYCEESALLNNIVPQLLKFYIKDAIVILDKIKYTTIYKNPSLEYSSELLNFDSIKKRQTRKIVDSINKYNSENNLLWTAGVTSVSLMDYETKKRVLGIKNDDYDTEGFEYYIGGLFEIGESDSIDNTTNDSIELYSPYIDSFDWRNRHGKNWMTSCKNQGESGYCSAFAINGALEAIANLYYNQKIDLDLSEQDIIHTFATYGNKNLCMIYRYGMNYDDVLPFLLEHGVLDEKIVPFIDADSIVVPPRPNGEEQLLFHSFDEVFNSSYNINGIKHSLICYGPLISGFHTDDRKFNHSMTLVGYHKIEAGDTVNHITTTYNGAGIISANDRRIGKTYWVFKDSYGDSIGGRVNGYMHILFNNNRNINDVFWLKTPLISKQYTDTDIICSDNDGDGYYFWGLGTKPSNLPNWVPNNADGDDSDAKFGPMNSYGHLMDLNPDNRDTIFITEETDWNSENYIWQHVVIKNGGLLNVSSKIKFYKGVNVLVQNGGELNIDGGYLENVNIEIVSNGKLSLKNKGKIKKYKRFYTAYGAIVRINDGFIN